MRLRADERGQAIQVGAVLLFALAMVAFAGYQAFVVPDQNRAVEADHADELLGDMHDLRNAVLDVERRDASRSVRLALGTNYPARVLALNPPGPSGTVRTLGTDDDRVNLTIANAEPTDDSARQLWADASAWDGRDPWFDTGAVSYRPNYHEFRNPPEVVYEHSILYAEFPGGTVDETGQRLIDGRRLSLTALDGSLDRTAGGSTSIDLRAVSASSRTIDLRDDGETIRLRFGSYRSAEEWEGLLRAAGETVGEGGHVLAVRPAGSVPGTDVQVVELELDDAVETYELELTKVGLGTDVTDGGATYVTDVSGDGTTVPAGTTVPLVAEVRDRYNNPVGGANVTATDPDGSFDVTRTSDADGRVRFDYLTTSAGDRQVDVELADSSDRPYESVTFAVEVYDAGSGGGGDGAYNVTWRSPAGEPGTENCDGSSCTLDYAQARELALTVETTPVADGGSVEYSVEDTDVGIVSPETGTTDASGTDSTTFEPEDHGVVNVYASSGGAGDAIEIEVVNYDESAAGPTIDSFDAQSRNHNNHARFDVQFQASAGGADITSAQVELVDLDTGNTADTWSETYGGASSVSESIGHAVEDNFGSGDDYVLRLTVTDADGEQAQEEIERTG